MASQPHKRCDVSKLNVGDTLSVNRYYKVKRKDGGHLLVEDLELGKELRIGNPIVERECYSHNQFDKTKKITATALAKLLEAAGDTVFTCTFRKKVTLDQVDSVLHTAYAKDPDVLEVPAKRRKLSREVLQGEKRTLVGVLSTKETGQGRSKVFDLEKPHGRNERQIDHRTIEEFVYKNTRYVRK